MYDFEFYAPTRVVFGRGTENKVGALVKEYGGTSALIHYGGGSAVRSGLIQRVRQSLEEAGISYVELGGVVPNPHLSLVYQAKTAMYINDAYGSFPILICRWCIRALNYAGRPMLISFWLLAGAASLILRKPLPMGWQMMGMSGIFTAESASPGPACR